MYRDHPTFAAWNSKAWDDWREREKTATSRSFRFCAECGFVHRDSNHAPKKASAEKGAAA